jgi:hypothetical protein
MNYVMLCYIAFMKGSIDRMGRSKLIVKNPGG